MEDIDILEEVVESRKVEMEDFRSQHELFLQSLNEEQLTEYLVNMYADNDLKINQFNLKTISEEDTK